MGIPENPHKLDPQSPQALVGIPVELPKCIRTEWMKPRKTGNRDWERHCLPLAFCYGYAEIYANLAFAEIDLNHAMSGFRPLLGL
jgi:hypothetical protein